MSREMKYTLDAYTKVHALVVYENEDGELTVVAMPDAYGELTFEAWSDSVQLNFESRNFSNFKLSATEEESILNILERAKD